MPAIPRWKAPWARSPARCSWCRPRRTWTCSICYATQNRQTAVRELSKLVDVILVVGAKNSSNSNRLREIGAEAGIPSYLIADGSELASEWVKDANTIGITAGASAPEVLVEDVIDTLRTLGEVEV